MSNNNFLTDLPNIGQTLAIKLQMVGITNAKELTILGSEEAIIRLSSLECSDACINMLYAIEGAIQGIRWHDLPHEKKLELLEFYNRYCK